MKACSPNFSPILILGATGQVGRALSALLGSERCVVLNRQQASLEQPDKLPSTLAPYMPYALINAAAFTQVDLAETEEAKAVTANAVSPKILAKWCKDRRIPFVHFSTDYVFPGTGTKPWSEGDATAPVNAYGRSKLEGEKAIQSVGGHYLIFRTSWVYDQSGKNFLNTMLKLGAERETLRVVADQIGAPTYAPHLAAATLKALEFALTLEVFPSGIYHLCGAGETSWHGFAEAIFAKAKARGIQLKVQHVEAIETACFPTPARRPLNSRMTTEKARKILKVSLPSWEESLIECLEKRP